MEILKHGLVIIYGQILIMRDVYQKLMRQYLTCAIVAELHMMRHIGMFGKIVGVDPNEKDVKLSTQKFLMTFEPEWVFMTRLFGENRIIKVLVDNQAALNVFKNEALVPNIRAGRKASISGIVEI